MLIEMDTQIANMVKLRILVIVALVLFFAGISEVFSQTAHVYRIQSLYLYSFAKEVKWENTEGACTIGVYGSNKAYEEIRSNMSGKTIWGQEINTIEIASPNDLADCHIVFMPRSSTEKILDFIDEADLSFTLLVTEDDLVDFGAAISFVYEQSKIRFKISRSKIEQVGLKVSKSLVSLGISV